MRRFAIAFLLSAVTWTTASAQSRKKPFSHADTLRGSNGPGRAWWDAAFYDLHVTINPVDSSIRGHNTITYRVLSAPTEMQIDLQEPLVVDSMLQDGRTLTFRRDGNAFFVALNCDRSPSERKKRSPFTTTESRRPRNVRRGTAG